MPTYEYRCPEGHEFELFQRITDPPEATCPHCGAAAERQLSAGAGLLFKGSGFYITDYRSETYKKAAEAETGSGSKAAEDGAGGEKPASADGKRSDSGSSAAGAEASAGKDASRRGTGSGRTASGGQGSGGGTGSGDPGTRA